MTDDTPDSPDTPAEETLESIKAERDALRAAAEAATHKTRKAALADAIASKLGFNNRTILNGVIGVLADEGELDAAPETLEPEAVTAAAVRVREALGDLLKPRSSFGGMPGVDLSTKPEREHPGRRGDAIGRVQDIADRLANR